MVRELGDVSSGHDRAGRVELGDQVLDQVADRTDRAILGFEALVQSLTVGAAEDVVLVGDNSVRGHRRVQDRTSHVLSFAGCVRLRPSFRA
jgi:hypothetical protein